MYYHFKPRATDQPTSYWLGNPQARFLPLSIRDTFSPIIRTRTPFANSGSLGKPWPRALIVMNITKAELGVFHVGCICWLMKISFNTGISFQTSPPPRRTPKSRSLPFRLCSSSRTNTVPGPYPLANPLKHLPEITLKMLVIFVRAFSVCQIIRGRFPGKGMSSQICWKKETDTNLLNNRRKVFKNAHFLVTLSSCWYQLNSDKSASCVL